MHTSPQYRFVTFADGSGIWARSARRLARQAEATGWFSQVEIYNLARIESENPEWARVNREFIESNRRGFGYWIWKPEVVRLQLAQLTVRESGVFYVDAGCSLNDNDAASKRFLDYVEMAQRLHGLFFRLGKEHLGRRWIKLATLHYFEKTNNVELKSTQLCVAGIFAISKSSQGLELLEKWSELMTLQEGNLLLDAAPGETQLHEFIEHRHDQSILTGLIEKSAFAILDDETYFEGSWKGRALNYPIWATRLRSGFSSTSTSAIWKAVRKVERSLYGRE